MKVKSENEVTQSCPTLSDPMDCSLPGSSVHGIFQARVLDWVAIAFSDTLGYPQASSWARDRVGAIELGSKADRDEKSSEMVKINQISSPKGAKERKIIVKPWPIKHVRATVYRTSSLATPSSSRRRARSVPE